MSIFLEYRTGENEGYQAIQTKNNDIYCRRHLERKSKLFFFFNKHIILFQACCFLFPYDQLYLPTGFRTVSFLKITLFFFGKEKFCLFCRWCNLEISLLGFLNLLNSCLSWIYKGTTPGGEYCLKSSLYFTSHFTSN